MMTGGLFMVGFGLMAMLIVIGLPVALMVVLAASSTRQGNSPAPDSIHEGKAPTRTCSYCGTDLHPTWSHCPQCGAQV